MAAIACCVVLLVAWLSFVLTTSNTAPKTLAWVRRRLHSVRRCLHESKAANAKQAQIYTPTERP